jgi:hypothetical protein
VTYQLRIYQIQEGALEGFVDEWRENVAPLRRRFGFEIVGAWAVQEASQFVWIIGHDDFAGADKGLLRLAREGRHGPRSPPAHPRRGHPSHV